ncbi:MAG TPA: hypothetical protein VKY74_12445, partial [Chloroflexia bacterium]|nr:hypothetical protein [Chloroflexia bacterium]
ASGALLFDGPWRGPDPPPTPQPGRLPARRLLVDNPNGTLHIALALNPDEFTAYRCTDAGVWGYWLTNGQASLGESQPLAPNLLVAYQAFGSAQPVTPVLPNPRWVVSGIAPDGQHLLLLDTTGLGGTHWAARLYRADPSGADPQPLADLPGAPGTELPAALGADLVFPLYRPLSDTASFRNMFWLLAAGGPPPLRLLVDVPVAAPHFEDHFPAQLVVRRQGPQAGQLVVTWPEGDHAVVRLIDPAHPDRATGGDGDFRTRPGLRDLHLLSEAADGTLLLGAAPPATGAAAALNTIVDIPPGRPIQEITLPVPAGAGLLDTWVRAGRVIYTTGSYAYTPYAPAAGYTFYSLPLDHLAAAPVPMALYSATVASAWPALGPPWHVGAGLLAYITAGDELHARSYDGQQDWLLERGVRALAVDNPAPAP